MIQTLTLSEMEEIAAGYDLKEVAEAFLVGAGVGAIVSGGKAIIYLT